MRRRYGGPLTAEALGDRRCAVELETPGLTARVSEVVAWIGDGHLAPFLEGLAADCQ
ncbi:DUF6228 family protein [Streptomyces sp. VB1]|uniref:DUF6228 family protein n=1 Tax=Streptomyces sp. VB1 TaxID=2986803 RepID=UPI002241F15C|nr:DUF6228 family protein [Streptomyces sp. VB1]UZI32402.1 DUF6228 family protein [Streptomyces sp. VB1]